MVGEEGFPAFLPGCDTDPFSAARLHQADISPGPNFIQCANHPVSQAYIVSFLCETEYLQMEN